MTQFHLTKNELPKRKRCTFNLCGKYGRSLVKIVRLKVQVNIYRRQDSNEFTLMSMCFDQLPNCHRDGECNGMAWVARSFKERRQIASRRALFRAGIYPSLDIRSHDRFGIPDCNSLTFSISGKLRLSLDIIGNESNGALGNSSLMFSNRATVKAPNVVLSNCTWKPWRLSHSSINSLRSPSLKEFSCYTCLERKNTRKNVR